MFSNISKHILQSVILQSDETKNDLPEFIPLKIVRLIAR